MADRRKDRIGARTAEVGEAKTAESLTPERVKELQRRLSRALSTREDERWLKVAALLREEPDVVKVREQQFKPTVASFCDHVPPWPCPPLKDFGEAVIAAVEVGPSDEVLGKDQFQLQIAMNNLLTAHCPREALRAVLAAGGPNITKAVKWNPLHCAVAVGDTAAAMAALAANPEHARDAAPHVLTTPLGALLYMAQADWSAPLDLALFDALLKAQGVLSDDDANRNLLKFAVGCGSLHAVSALYGSGVPVSESDKALPGLAICHLGEEAGDGTSSPPGAATSHDMLECLFRAGVPAQCRKGEGHHELAHTFWAAQCDRAECMRVLLKHGESLDEPVGRNGETPLVVAAARGAPNVTRMLLSEAQVNKFAKSSHGETAWAVAQEKGHPE
eukprot:CAMPEP_0170147916 /NCGR_PEP_ID=MMETSP0033_2-20121228/36425_1 /TAXON_ID=195969 /ORGANISM="Dolichomastix tenuilepis, Strain CCMP3274" /LENGTH=388 /DNA_ID=CAMNT_0010384763 /DNA_START=34 /DNA_END=1197 /DNA_ORIENTATION=+